MTLGAWIFLSVVLVLVVLNKPFRKFFLWAAAISAVCCGLVYGYIWVADWREHRAMAREAAIQQKKQDDCNARLNAVSSRDAMENMFERLANADRCRANPNITAEEAAELKPGEVLAPPGVIPDTLPPDFFEKGSSSAPQSTGLPPVSRKSIQGTVTKDAVVYSESSPAGPDGQVLGKVESGTHVRIIRLDSIFGNVQVRTPGGITGWLRSDEINY
jgi:hypothetical protein